MYVLQPKIENRKTSSNHSLHTNTTAICWHYGRDKNKSYFPWRCLCIFLRNVVRGELRTRGRSKITPQEPCRKAARSATTTTNMTLSWLTKTKVFRIKAGISLVLRLWSWSHGWNCCERVISLPYGTCIQSGLRCFAIKTPWWQYFLFTLIM